MLFVDDLGHELKLEDYPQRIVSLVPSITLTLFDLGADHLLVGRTKFCVEPKEKVDSIKTVGGTKQVDFELIASLSPDLILLNKEENTKEIYFALKEIAPVFVSEVVNLEDNYRMIIQLGELTNTSSKAEEIVKETIENFAQLDSNISPKNVLYFIWKDPYLSVGGDTFIHQMIESMGWKNIYATKKRYPQVDVMEAQKLQPDIILLSSEPYPFKEKHIQEMQVLFPKSKILLVNGEYFSWHGSKIRFSPNYFQKLLAQITS